MITRQENVYVLVNYKNAQSVNYKELYVCYVLLLHRIKMIS